MSRLLFGIVAAGILIGISYFTAKIYATGFRLSAPLPQIIFLVFLLTSLAFVVSIALVRNGGGSVGALFYTLVQTAGGFGLYLFLGAIVLGILLGAGRLVSFPITTTTTSIVLGGSMLLGIIGLVQARFITTVSYTIELPDAPVSWNGKTAALVADTHFGIINKARFSNKVVAKILSLEPDFVLHAGDFYDGPALATAPITASWKRLADQVPVFFAPGNHEQYGNYGAFIDSIRAGGITVLDDKIVTYDGVQIVGLRYRDGVNGDEITDALAAMNIDPAIHSIAINHVPTRQERFNTKGIDLLVSGHTHRGQFWPLNFLVRAIYGQYYYGQSSFRGLQTITTSGVGTFGPPFRLFNPPEIVLIQFKTK